MAKNSNLNRAKANKNDEFFTRYTDVANEIGFYCDYLKGKTVYCNADNPYISNFYKFLRDNFAGLKLKKLYATNFLKRGGAYKAEYTSENGEEITTLNGDGDFRSDECLEILNEADVVITNPPFSLFREFITLLLEHRKKFLVIGNRVAVTLNCFFPSLQNKEVWVGRTFPCKFLFPDGITPNPTQVNSLWYTNLGSFPYRPTMRLKEWYSPRLHPRLDGFNGILVGKLKEIPRNFYGTMAVPITFMQHWNPDQFDVVGKTMPSGLNDFNLCNASVGGKNFFARILIRRVQYIPPFAQIGSRN